MPTDVRIALLIVGIVLLAAAVIGAVVAAARKNSLRSGHIQRIVVAVAGAALIVWTVTIWPRAAHEYSHAATVAAAQPAAAVTGGSSGAGAGAAAPAAADVGAQNAAHNAPTHPDLIFLADSVFDGCVAPTKPGDVPDGTKATRAQMLAAQITTKAFDAATDVYQSCLSTAATDFVRQYGRGLSASNLQAVDAMHTRINNTALDVDQSVAGRFNQQLRIFNARPARK